MLACYAYRNRDANPSSAPFHSTESHGSQKFNILLKLDGERYVCFVAYYKRGNSGCQAEGEGKGKGKRAEKVTRGGGVTT